MSRWVGWGALAVVLTLAAACGGGDSGSQPSTTTTTGSQALTTTSTGGTATAATTTTTVAPATPYEEFLADPEAFIEAHSDLINPSQDLLSGSPDYAAAQDFEEEVEALGLDLTGVEVWVWPVTATGDNLLILDFDTTASSFEDSDVGEALGEAMAESSTLVDAGITHAVIAWQGRDSDGPFSITFSVPFDVLKTAIVTGDELNEDDVALHISRGN